MFRKNVLFREGAGREGGIVDVLAGKERERKKREENGLFFMAARTEVGFPTSLFGGCDAPRLAVPAPRLSLESGRICVNKMPVGRKAVEWDVESVYPGGERGPPPAPAPHHLTWGSIRSHNHSPHQHPRRAASRTTHVPPRPPPPGLEIATTPSGNGTPAPRLVLGEALGGLCYPKGQ